MKARPRCGVLGEVSIGRRAAFHGRGKQGLWRDGQMRDPPTRGGEEVLASRLTGTGLWDLTVRRDTATATVLVGDRIVDERDTTRVWNIRWIADLEGRGYWLTMTAESGVADG
jgi:hypothetical protein